MADVEPQIAEGTTVEDGSSGPERVNPTQRTASTAHGPGMRSGITWWEACGGWNSRYSLSI